MRRRSPQYKAARQAVLAALSEGKATEKQRMSGGTGTTNGFPAGWRQRDGFPSGGRRGIHIRTRVSGHRYQVRLPLAGLRFAGPDAGQVRGPAPPTPDHQPRGGQQAQ
jgi:hypothetical protein